MSTFELLDYPVTAVGDGNLVVFDAPARAKLVRLRGTEHHVVDVSRDQSATPWLVTQEEILLLVGSGRRELAFRTESFGQVLGVGSFYPTLCAGVSEHGGAILGLNTTRGAQLISATEAAILSLTPEPLPALLSSCSERAGTPVFTGMTLRTQDDSIDTDAGGFAVGSPLIVSVQTLGPDQVSVEAKQGGELFPLAQWAASLPAALAANSRFVQQLKPEMCVVAEWSRGGRAVVSLAGLQDFYDPLDVLGRYPSVEEVFGLVFASANGEPSRVEASQCPVASLRTQSGHFLYVGSNRGGGPPLGSLQRVSMQQDSPTSQPVAVRGVDAALKCSSFNPCFHPRIGHFATLRAGTGDRPPRAYFVHSDDGLQWELMGDETSIETVDP